MNMIIEAYKFSSYATHDKPELSGTISEFFERIYRKGCIFGQDSMLRMGEYRIHGWAFNFKPYLKRYVYKQYCSWSEAYAPNKTKLRETIHGQIAEIHEIPMK